MEYEAMSDQDTLINIANHSHFNLSAKDSKIYDHQLMIKSDSRLHMQMRMVFQQVSFWMQRIHHLILKVYGERIHDDDEQLRFVGGYDHCFMLKDEKDQAVLYVIKKVDEN